VLDTEEEMRGSLTEWRGTGSAKWKLRVYTGRDGRNRPTYQSRNFTGSRRRAESALGKLVADLAERQATTNRGSSVRHLLTRWLADIEPILPAPYASTDAASGGVPCPVENRRQARVPGWGR
jgi:hypothetical protein